MEKKEELIVSLKENRKKKLEEIDVAVKEYELLNIIITKLENVKPKEEEEEDKE